jgi:hypothetical protein
MATVPVNTVPNTPAASAAQTVPNVQAAPNTAIGASPGRQILVGPGQTIMGTGVVPQPRAGTILVQTAGGLAQIADPSAPVLQTTGGVVQTGAVAGTPAVIQNVQQVGAVAGTPLIQGGVVPQVINAQPQIINAATVLGAQQLQPVFQTSGVVPQVINAQPQIVGAATGAQQLLGNGAIVGGNLLAPAGFGGVGTTLVNPGVGLGGGAHSGHIH